jgi:type I restriction enzyme S subunit
VASLQKARQQLKVYRQAVLKRAFEGRLAARKQEEDIRRRGAEDAEGRGGLPEGWRWVALSAVAEVSGGITKNSKRESLAFKVPFLRVANVYFDRLELGDVHLIGVEPSEIARAKLESGDLIFVEGNGSLEQIGRVALWNGSVENCVHQNHLIKARLGTSVLPKFALHFFCSKIGRRTIEAQATSTNGLHTLNLTKIGAFSLPLPPLPEQHAIVAEIERRFSVADALEATIDQSLKKAEALRQSILQKAFRGELVPQKDFP